MVYSLPATRARLATSIEIFVDVYQGDRFVLEKIGAISEMSRELKRGVKVRRGLDTIPPGVGLDVMPEPSEITLTIKRAVLYEADLLRALGYSFLDLVEQNFPFKIIETRASLLIPAIDRILNYLTPEDKKVLGIGKEAWEEFFALMTYLAREKKPLTERIHYEKCLFESIPLTYSLEREFLIIEEAKIIASRIRRETQFEWLDKVIRWIVEGLKSSKLAI